jgi:hypothetical protein
VVPGFSLPPSELCEFSLFFHKKKKWWKNLTAPGHFRADVSCTYIMHLRGDLLVDYQIAAHLGKYDNYTSVHFRGSLNGQS